MRKFKIIILHTNGFQIFSMQLIAVWNPIPDRVYTAFTCHICINLEHFLNLLMNLFIWVFRHTDSFNSIGQYFVEYPSTWFCLLSCHR